MDDATPKSELSKDVDPSKIKESAKPQAAASTVQIEDLLNFSFAEVALQSRVILNLKGGLACS